MKDAVRRNQEIYNAPGVTAYYGALDYLTQCERLLFETYIPVGSSILDLGVGGGRTTRFLSQGAARYLGIDNAPAMIEACRTKFPGLDFRVGDAADLSSFAPASFDVVVFAFNGIDFVLPEAARRSFLKHSERVLKPGGTLIFSSHNARAIMVRPSWNRERLERIAQRFSAGSKGAQFALLTALIPPRIILACGQALAATLRRAVKRLPTSTFWRGYGEWTDSAHGGLFTHYSVPKQVVAEVNAVHLRCDRIVGNEYPRSGHSLTTDWYYYVFVKPIKK